MPAAREPVTLPAVLVTGAARRLGASIARAFDRAGYHVVVHFGTSAAEAEVLAAELASAETVGCDLGDPDAARAMIAALADRLVDWRGLVNCAAVFRPDTHRAIDLAVFDEAMAVNVAAPVMLAQSYLSTARAIGGRRVINLLDQKLANMNPDFFSYTLSKQALAGATTMLAMGCAAHGNPDDRVYGLSPGAMLPSFDQHSQEHEISGRLNLLRRLTAPEELADAAVFLAKGVLESGQVLTVDSGQHLIQQPRDVLFLAREQAG